MPINAQTIQEAKDHGYGESQIYDFITKSDEYRTAKKAGYADSQIFDHLGFKKSAAAKPETSDKNPFVEGFKDPFKIVGETAAGIANLPVKAYKGWKGITALRQGLMSGKGLDASLQSATEAIGDRNPVQSPLGPSMTSQALSKHVLQPGVNALGNATGQPELVQGAVEAGGDIAALVGLKPALSAGGGIAKNVLKTVADTQLPEKLYASAVKLPLSKAWTKEIGPEGMSKRKMAVTAGLEGKVPSTEVGIAKAKNLEKNYRAVVDSAVTGLDKTGRMIPKERLRDGLAEAYKVAGTEGTEAAERIVNSLYSKRFEKMGTMVKTGERQIPDPTSGGFKTEPIYDRQYKPSEIQQIKRHLYKMENYERQKLSRGLSSQLKELGNKGMAHEAKTALEEMNPELKGLNEKDAAYINLVDALERSVPRIQNKDMAGLGFKILLTGSRPGMAILELVSGAPRVKAAVAIALNKARKLGKAPVAKNAAKAAASGIAKTATTPQTIEEDKLPWKEIGTDEE